MNIDKHKTHKRNAPQDGIKEEHSEVVSNPV